MATKKKVAQAYKEISFADTKPGMVVRVHQIIKDVNSKGEEKERVQVYEGMVIRHRGGKETGATVTVRKIAEGVGVEKIFPINIPTVKKVEFVKAFKVRRANLDYLATSNKRLKELPVA
jgi:large subunit ribosomal protein L19